MTDLVTHMKLMSGLALALLLTACGGGGGGGSSAVSPVTSGGGGTSGGGSSGGGTVENVRIGLVFNSINLEYETTYAQLTPSNANSVSAWRTVLDSYVALLGNAISSVLVPNAVAQTSQLRAIDSSEASEISKLFFDSELQSIDSNVTAVELDENDDPVLDENGDPKIITIECDLSTVELYVSDVRRLNLEDGSLIAEVLLPVELTEDCAAIFRLKTIVIDSQKSVFDITDDFQLSSVVTLVAAKDPTFNISNEAVVDFGDGIIRGLSFDNDVLTIEELSASTVDIRTDRLGRFIYDGTSLTGIRDADGSLALLTFTKGSTAFDIFRPDPNESSGYQSMAYLAFGAESEKLLINRGRVRYLDLDNEAATDLDLEPELPEYCNDYDPSNGYGASVPPECLYFGSLNAGQVFLGRYQDWLIDTEAALNYKTGEYSGQLGCLPQIILACGNAGEFSDYLGNQIYVVDDSRVKFIRFNIETREYSLINLDEWGYLADSDYYITPDNAYNKEFIEISYDLETVTLLGVITEGSRAVKEFYTPSG